MCFRTNANVEEVESAFSKPEKIDNDKLHDEKKCVPRTSEKLETKSCKKKNVALFGGSFDPPHKGHQKIVQEILRHKNLEIDEVWVIPARINPLKSKNPAPGEHRAAMLKLLFQKDGRVRILDWELKQNDKSYTFHTLEHLTKENPDYVFSFVLGSDQTLTKWFRANDIAQMVNFILIKRAGYDKSPDDVFKGVVAVSFQFIDIYYNISSTEMREALVNEGIPQDMTLPVIEYVKDNRLYVKDDVAFENLKCSVTLQSMGREVSLEAIQLYRAESEKFSGLTKS